MPSQTYIENEELIDYIPIYNENNKESTDNFYDAILEENKKLMASATNYDEIDENGNLFLKGESIGKQLYKHKFSKDLYGGNIDDNEKSVIKTMKINPISPTNYITGLYAPPGEVIKIEFSNNDLENIGGSLEFIIGQVTQDGVGSDNSKNVGLQRIPILYNKLIITKNPGYIGSFIGGPIYISNPSKRKIFTLTISNAVPYKHIIYGITSKEEFEQMDSFSAPFFELDVRDSIRYSGPLQVIEGLNYENLINNLIFWDKCVRTSKKIPGGSGTIKGIHFLFDPCVNTPGALAVAIVGQYWCQVPLSFKMALNYETVTKYGAWGHIHELNHHYQYFGFSSSVLNEVTNNIVNLVEYIMYSQISGLRNEYSEAAITTVSGNHRNLNPEFCLNSLVNSPPTADNEIRFYEPILQAFGYDLFIKVTQYGKGKGGVDLFYQALTETLHYDFTYYVEKILNLKISENIITECQSHGYHIFIPVSSIYQTGRYFNYESHQYFSNTSLPYRIPRGGPSKLDFINHIIVPNGFTYEIKEITEPHYGKLEKISDLLYTYTPDEIEDLSGIIKLTLHLQNAEEGISTNVRLGLNFQVDNSQSVQTNYLYDNIIYTSIYDAIEKDFEGYASMEFLTNFQGSMSGIKEGNIGIWEGKFKIDDEGYKYILYKGGRGPSVLYAKINDETEYTKIGEIAINQNSYMFSGTSKAFYQIDLEKDDIVYFKVYLLGKDLSNGATAWINLGISKTDDASQVRTLDNNDIIGINAEIDQPYVFYSGDPYKTDKIFNSNSFFDYTLIEVSSTNFFSWDNSPVYNLEKMIDNNENTYMHTRQDLRISKASPLILDFDLGKLYYFDYIIFNRGPKIKGWNLPLNLNLLTSEDGINWNEEGEFTTEKSGERLAELNIGKKLYTRYIRFEITKQIEGNYVAIATIEFIEKNLLLYQKMPEYVEFEGKEDIDINFDNFPYFGHSYILKENCAISFLIDETTGIRIKVCHKYDSAISLIVDNDKNNKINIQINASDELDFPIEIRDLTKGKHRFKIEVNSGQLDFEYILYEA